MNAEAASSAGHRDELDLPRHKLTAAQVMAMVDAGILREEDPVEFLRGELIPMAPQGPIHQSVHDWIHLLLAEHYGRPTMVSGQGPLACGTDSLPEPDVMVLRNRQWMRERRHPRSDEALLVIEVAHTSQRRDRFKAGVYAEAGIPEYWLIDLTAERLELHRHPLQPEGRYAEVRVLGLTERLVLPELGHELTVAELLP